MTDALAITNNDQLKQVLQLRLEGHTLKECSATVGISVNKILRMIARHLKDNPSEQIEEYRAAELEKYDRIETRLLKKVDKTYLKVNSGTVVMVPMKTADGNVVLEVNPKTNMLEPVMVELTDDGPQNEATGLLLKLWDRRAKLLGLDRPVLKAPEGEKPPEHPPERDVELVRAAIRHLGITRMVRAEDTETLEPTNVRPLTDDPILRH